MALRRADEAGDLAGVARAFANNATDRDGADDLRLLLDHYAAWRRQIESMIEKDARPQPKPPEPEPHPAETDASQAHHASSQTALKQGAPPPLRRSESPS